MRPVLTSRDFHRRASAQRGREKQGEPLSIYVVVAGLGLVGLPLESFAADVSSALRYEPTVSSPSVVVAHAIGRGVHRSSTVRTRHRLAGVVRKKKTQKPSICKQRL